MKSQTINNLQEASTVNDIAGNIPRINANPDDCQLGNQSSMVKIEGTILQILVSILIEPGSSLTYISPTVVENCKLIKEIHKKSSLVQLATSTKRKVTYLLRRCMLDMNGMITITYLNIILLGSYEVLIGMDWLESHKGVINCLDKTFMCVDDEGEDCIVRGIPRPITIRNFLGI